MAAPPARAAAAREDPPRRSRGAAAPERPCRLRRPQVFFQFVLDGPPPAPVAAAAATAVAPVAASAPVTASTAVAPSAPVPSSAAVARDRGCPLFLLNWGGRRGPLRLARGGGGHGRRFRIGGTLQLLPGCDRGKKSESSSGRFAFAFLVGAPLGRVHQARPGRLLGRRRLSFRGRRLLALGLGLLLPGRGPLRWRRRVLPFAAQFARHRFLSGLLLRQRLGDDLSLRFLGGRRFPRRRRIGDWRRCLGDGHVFVQSGAKPDRCRFLPLAPGSGGLLLLHSGRRLGGGDAAILLLVGNGGGMLAVVGGRGRRRGRRWGHGRVRRGRGRGLDRPGRGRGRRPPSWRRCSRWR